MSTAVDALIARWSADDTFDHTVDELLDLQLAAARERFATHREAVRVLDRRADDAGIETIDRLDDLIPLLLSHTSYKSYPDAFVRGRRWDRLAAWVGSLSTGPIGEVDFEGVEDIDAWLERMQAAGHVVTSSSGTTGRTSFLNMNGADVERMRLAFIEAVREVTGFEGNDRVAFLAIPPGTITVVQLCMSMFAEVAARPDDVHLLSNEPLRVAELARLGDMRRAIADGTATPADIAAAEREAREREARMGAEVESFVEQILARRDQPQLITGTFALLWRIVETAKQKGIPDGEFDPSTITFGGGGLKGLSAPPDFMEQMRAFFGAVQEFVGYGMSELSAPFPRCSAGRYHAPPTTVLLVLDKTGEHLAGDPEGLVEGRFAALDLLLDGRWGGVISGDRVTVDYEPCACGRRSPGVVEIVRYSDLPEGDDKLSCAGAVDAYVRGEIGAAA